MCGDILKLGAIIFSGKQVTHRVWLFALRTSLLCGPRVMGEVLLYGDV
jgi:hypothetical protein